MDGGWGGGGAAAAAAAGETRVDRIRARERPHPLRRNVFSPPPPRLSLSLSSFRPRTFPASMMSVTRSNVGSRGVGDGEGPLIAPLRT